MCGFMKFCHLVICRTITTFKIQNFLHKRISPEQLLNNTTFHLPLTGQSWQQLLLCSPPIHFCTLRMLYKWRLFSLNIMNVLNATQFVSICSSFYAEQYSIVIFHFLPFYLQPPFPLRKKKLSLNIFLEFDFHFMELKGEIAERERL